MTLNEKQIGLLTKIYERKSTRKLPIADMLQAFEDGGCKVKNIDGRYKLQYNKHAINSVILEERRPPEIKSLDKKFSNLACQILLDSNSNGFEPDYMKQRSTRGFENFTHG